MGENKNTYIIELREIEKEYYGNKVLKGVSLAVKPGEIHALVGENGAGKSTLMNIIFGMPVIFSTGGFTGEILFEGRPVEIKSPKDAMELGIGMVHQEFMLLPGFTITENIKLNREILKDNVASRIFGPKLKTLDVAAMRKDAKKALNELGMNVDEWLPVAGLPVGYMQFVEIAREIDKKNVKLLIFDEPTAVLAESEAEKLLDAMKMLAAKGIGILFITHRLNEVLAVADNITVLRDGEKVGSMRKEEASVEKMAQMMVGRKIERVEKSKCRVEKSSEVILSIRNLYVDMPGKEVKGVNLDIYRGEILGIGGLAGQGKIGIANGIMGLYRAKGEVYKNGKKIELNNPRKAMEKGLAFVSEDRRGVGLMLDESIELNIAIGAMQVKGMFLKPLLGLNWIKLLDERKVRENALKYIKELDIRCTGPTQKTRQLSGGNQQKVCIAKALVLEPDILFVSEPTRGIDIGAKKLVLDLLVKLNVEKGMTIVMTVKGDEMTVGTYMGFSIVSLMCIGWLLLPFRNPEMVWAIGGRGLRTTITLANKYDKVLDRLITLPNVDLPIGTFLFFAVCCFFIWLFLRSKTGIAMMAAGSNPRFAQASGINVDLHRTIGTILSMVLGGIGILVYAQSYGFFQLYTGPLMMPFAAISAILIGGATARKASISNVIAGVILFQSLLTISLPVINRMMPEGNLSEVVRIIVSNGVILYALTRVGGNE